MAKRNVQDQLPEEIGENEDSFRGFTWATDAIARRVALLSINEPAHGASIVITSMNIQREASDRNANVG